MTDAKCPDAFDSVKLPKGYKGFKFLRFLELDDVSISVDCIKKLVSCCPILENLRLIKCRTRNILNIHAPNLKSLHLYGQIYEKESYKKKNPNRDFGGAPKLENLELGRRFIDRFLAEGLVPGKFPMIFQNLKELRLDWDLNKETEAKFILSLLQNSPNLQMCRFPYHPKSSIPKFWESLKLQEFSFQPLQAVNILWNSSIEKIRTFIEIVLGSAPKLRKVNIEQTMECDKDDEICLKHLVLFPRASIEAQIIFESEVAKLGIGFEADYLD
ncbi:hypothetical protein LUZ60_003980 [Juncus effusus]|nr:hypothetical protein LUZ60_003980 [Juncus effusus]